MSRRLRHDAAFAAAHVILEMVEPCLLNTETARSEAFGRLYLAITATLEKYDEEMDRERERLCLPSRN